MPKATVNGVETSYEVQGAGTPAIFIHGGFGGTASTIVAAPPRVVTEILPRDQVRLVTYDRRCAGQTAYVLEEYSLDDLASDARALLEHLGIERSIVIGDSMGGMVAQQYALSYPQAVSALCLVETGANLMGPTDFGKGARAIVDRYASEGDRAMFESRKEQFRNPPQPPGGGAAFGPASAEADERARQQREAMLAALEQLSDEELFTYSTGMIRNQAAFIGYDLGPRLGELSMPVAIIHGNADTTVPFELGKALHDAIEQSEFHEIDDARHGLLQYPDAQAALKDWVARVSTPA